MSDCDWGAVVAGSALCETKLRSEFISTHDLVAEKDRYKERPAVRHEDARASQPHSFCIGDGVRGHEKVGYGSDHVTCSDQVILSRRRLSAACPPG